MADGFALIEVNCTGKGRMKEVSFFDYRLENADFDSDYILEELTQQLPEGINDVLVLSTFNYVCNESYDHWNGVTEYEDIFNLESHLVVKDNYKEFERELITNSLEESKGLYESDKDFIKLVEQDIKEWEEFFEEDFKPFQKESIRVENIEDLFK